MIPSAPLGTGGVYVNATDVQGTAVSATPPVAGDIMRLVGGEWTPTEAQVVQSTAAFPLSYTDFAVGAVSRTIPCAAAALPTGAFIHSIRFTTITPLAIPAPVSACQLGLGHSTDAAALVDVATGPDLIGTPAGTQTIFCQNGSGDPAWGGLTPQMTLAATGGNLNTATAGAWSVIVRYFA